MEHWIRGYQYCKDPKKRHGFVGGGELIMSRPDAWLGPGMYMWDNPGNAQRCGGEGAFLDGSAREAVVSADVNVDHVLDLTDPYYVRLADPVVRRVVDVIEARTGSRPTIGELLAYMFSPGPAEDWPESAGRLHELVSKWTGAVSVVKAATLREGAPGATTWLNTLLSGAAPRPTLDCMAVYCVKRDSAIRSPALLTSGREEQNERDQA